MAGIELNNQLADQQKQRIVFSNDGNVQEFSFYLPKRYAPQKEIFGLHDWRFD